MEKNVPEAQKNGMRKSTVGGDVARGPWAAGGPESGAEGHSGLGGHGGLWRLYS